MAFGSSENIINGFKKLKSRITELEDQIEFLHEKMERLHNLEKIHLLRIKNGDEFSDDFIIKGTYYNDLSPEKAFEIYNQKDKDFVLLDVSEEGYEPIADFPEVTRIPLEELAYRIHELPSRATAILIISENGVRSIQACHKLHKHGFYNLNNISGGYAYWPGFNNLRAIKSSQVFSA
ncbi:MAG: hypothetical protein CME62_14625 [Halobacteriovoraceae bacterium]|nr:hypothetical protein [Halobacteriovoraceae bacterium]|tara:strand:+ start:6379 stop:6912 length:534 start_codon:yes stop_codon:yes gene_type:complete